MSAKLSSKLKVGDVILLKGDERWTVVARAAEFKAFEMRNEAGRRLL